MLEAFLTKDMDPGFALAVIAFLAIVGFAHGVSKAFGFYAAYTLYGYPNGSDHRPIMHGILCIIFMILCVPLVLGSFVGFYLVYIGVEIFGDRFPFYKRFDIFCLRAAIDMHLPKAEGGKQPPGWLRFIA